MTSAFDRPILVVSPVGGQYGGPVKGSTVFVATCGHRSWIAPAGRTFMAQYRPRSMCIPCLMQDPEAKAAVAAGDLASFIVPGADVEIAAELGQSVDDVRAWLRSKGLQ